jgi:hypothetical protein
VGAESIQLAFTGSIKSTVSEIFDHKGLMLGGMVGGIVWWNAWRDAWRYGQGAGGEEEEERTSSIDPNEQALNATSYSNGKSNFSFFLFPLSY